MPTIKQAVADRIRQVEQNLKIHMAMMHLAAGRTTPEAIAEYESQMKKKRQAEEARLAAIEAAKTPAQRLKEKQAACDHEFRDGNARSVCHICKLSVPKIFAAGYNMGHNVGYDAGYQERGQHDSDEE
jgi:hypothetical protein